MLHQHQLSRQIGYGVAFSLLIILSGLSVFNDSALQASIETNLIGDTIPSPGETIPAAGTNVNVLHLASFGPDTSVTITISGTKSLQTFNQIEIGDTTGYLSIGSGASQISVTPTGSTTPVINQSLTFQADQAYTVIVIGDGTNQPLSLRSLVDTTTASPDLMGKLRVVHAAPFSANLADTTLNIVTQAGDSVNPSLNNLQYGGNSGFLTLPTGKYDWKVELANDNSLYVDLPPFTLNIDAVLTLYIVGDGTHQARAGLLMILTPGSKPEILYSPAFLRS
ncbi:DUF4397 domain-containing protein [Chloroflexi bacterium TSY]|nr:DUF4397 domain-containing protein [Chloroflexi bacterium TSY]